MHKNATKCNETIGKWCKNKHGASKIIDTFETYQGGTASRGPVPPGGVEPPSSVSNLFSSRDFSYLVKIAKVLIAKFNANFF
jgi:hypothetical protein